MSNDVRHGQFGSGARSDPELKGVRAADPTVQPIVAFQNVREAVTLLRATRPVGGGRLNRCLAAAVGPRRLDSLLEIRQSRVAIRRAMAAEDEHVFLEYAALV